MNSTTPPLLAISVVLLMLSSAMPARAQDSGWETVVGDRSRQVQIDRGSIIESDNGAKVAWARVVMTPAEAATQGYTTIQALNRYDCRNRSFITVKRRYLDARNVVVREDVIDEQKPALIVRNSIDERLWNEVCKPPSMNDLAQLAAQADKAVAALASGSAVTQETGSVEPLGVAVETPEKAPVVERVAPARAEPPERKPAPVRDAGEPPVSIATPVPAPAIAPAPVAKALPVAPSKTPPPVAVKPVKKANRGTAPAAAKSPSAKVPPVPADAHWSYDGATGPEQWGMLRPEWALCAQGRQQSPIDIRDGVAVDLEPVQFDYRKTRFRITDTGTTLEVQPGDGMGIDLRGRHYALTHLQFHRPSQERVGGQGFPLAVHFHHRSADGRIAIVAVMLDSGGPAHAALQTLWNSLPLQPGDQYMPRTEIDLAGLLPEDRRYFLYIGSLTTPPCTEGVVWAVMQTPVAVADDQLQIFARLYPYNSRPIQASNGRLILQSR
ncbi:MAG: carbonic anhydrase family protein [Rhodocyclales bacterium]|nr:carbonic anhydrase family protein [Rhodocyclales bacterium]